MILESQLINGFCSFEGSLDRRGAVLVLRTHFVGTAKVDKRLMITQNMISMELSRDNQ